MFRSLRNRDFRLFYFGQIVSLTGNWMQYVAQSWLVYRLTHDPLALGLISFTGQIPALLLGLYAGVVVDRVDRRSMVLGTQAAALLQASALAALTLSGHVRLWHVYGLAALLGIVNAFDMPARQVFIGELVGPEDRHNAIALNSTIVNGTRIAGPAMAGMLVGAWGEGACFLLNALSYLAILGALLAMRGLRPAPPASGAGALDEIRGGFGYVFRHDSIRILLVALGVISACGMPFTALLPIFADEVLHSGAHGMGFLMGATGVGATLGAFLLARRRETRGLDRLVLRSAWVFAAALAAFALSRSLSLSIALMLAVGLGLMLQLSGINVLLQELADDRFRGRVMGFYSVMFLGVAPLGSLAAGALAAWIGAPWTVALGACVCALVTARFARLLPERVAQHQFAHRKPVIAGAELI